MSKFLFRSFLVFSLCVLVSNSQAQSISITASTPDTICSGTLVTFAATVSGVGSPHYQWLKNSLPVGVDSIHYSTAGLVNGDVIMFELVSAPGGTILALSAPRVMTVNTPGVTAPISGSATVCLLGTTTLTGGSAGGVWSSSSPLTAAVSATGVVTGEGTGRDTITYTITNACGTSAATHVMTVNTAPAVAAITGPNTLCIGGGTGTYAEVTTGGTWSLSNTTVAAFTTGSIVTPLTAGTDTVLYTLSNTCGTTVRRHPVTVATTPVVGPIAGATSVCQGDTIHLADATAGGNWRSRNNTIAGAGGGGTGGGVSNIVILGIGGGTTTIVYILTNACGTDSATTDITVNPLPILYPITGRDSVCAGSTVALSEVTGGGTWSSQHSGIATVDAGGNIYGVSNGIDSIYYTATNSCGKSVTGFKMAIYCPVVTGVAPVNPAKAIAIYPNPATDNIYVGGITPSMIEVVNIYGQLVTSARNTASISLTNLPSGVYYVTVLDDKGNVAAKQSVVKQ